jgi:hypothetical protein
MMTVNRSDNLVVSNLTFFTSNGYLGGTGGANVGIDVDRTLASGGTGTNDRFEKISIISGTQNPNFQGIRFAQATPNQNVENMTVRDSNRTGGDYYIASAWHYPNISDAVPGNSSGGSFTVNRGRMVLKPGAAGVADTMWVCAQTATGYAWKQVF